MAGGDHALVRRAIGQEQLSLLDLLAAARVADAQEELGEKTHDEATCEADAPALAANEFRSRTCALFNTCI